MVLAKNHFRNLGFHVEDHSRTKPYDLHCTKGTSILYVEVKGTRSLGDEIQLTPNEVEHTRIHGDKSVLFVVHSVQVTGTKIPTVNGGKVRIMNPFILDKGTLRPGGLPSAETMASVHEKASLSAVRLRDHLSKPIWICINVHGKHKL
jgi:hypothetical protein